MHGFQQATVCYSHSKVIWYSGVLSCEEPGVHMSCVISREKLTHRLRQKKDELEQLKLFVAWTSKAILLEAPHCFWLLC